MTSVIVDSSKWTGGDDPVGTNDTMENHDAQQKFVDFQTDLTMLINKHSLENGSNTPDFILAKFLTETLKDWNTALTVPYVEENEQHADYGEMNLKTFNRAKEERTEWFKPPVVEEDVDMWWPFTTWWKILKAVFLDPFNTTVIYK